MLAIRVAPEVFPLDAERQPWNCQRNPSASPAWWSGKRSEALSHVKIARRLECKHLRVLQGAMRHAHQGARFVHME
jgi:hypothetical protein